MHFILLPTISNVPFHSLAHYKAYTHGGGSFLVPYTFMLLFAGLPLFFMELALGQYSGAGPTRVFGRLAPIAKGLVSGIL